MKVRDVTSNDDHVVVGGSNVQAYSIAATPEMYEILSAGIYQKEIPACAREVICNAWDAHIVSGLQGIPVDITLTSDRLTIRDYGPGIADDMMKPIYCTYGTTTKGLNSEETGGFGLGSKAPYAYTMFFKVISNHKGKRRVYACSKGTLETNGVPDLRTIVTSKTSQTGLEVEIPVKSSWDANVFDDYIRTLTYFSGMLIRLNGEILPRLRREKIRDDIIVSDAGSDDHSYINLVYGTVIYPLPNDESLRGLENSVCNLYGLKNGYKLYIYLQPDSVSVQPSRESLRLTAQTKQVLIDKLTVLTEGARERLIRSLHKKLKKKCKQTAKQGSVGLLLKGFYNITDWLDDRHEETPQTTYTGYNSVFNRAVNSLNVSRLINTTDEEQHELVSRFFHYCKLYFPAFSAYFRIMQRVHKESIKRKSRSYATYQQRLNYLTMFNELILNRLNHEMTLPYKLKTYEYSHSDSLTDATEEKYVNYPYIFIGKTQAQCKEAMYFVKQKFGRFDKTGYPLIISSAGSQKKADTYMNDIRKAGLIPVDCTQIVVPKPVEIDYAVPDTYVPPVKLKGFMALGSFTEFHSSLPQLSDADTTRVENPMIMDYIVQQDYIRRPSDFPKASREVLRALAQIFPECALVSSPTVLNNNMRKNSQIITLRRAFFDALWSEAMSDPNFAKALVIHADDNNYEDYARSRECLKIYELIKDNPDLPYVLRLLPLTHQQEAMLIVVKSLGDRFGFRNHKSSLLSLLQYSEVKRFRKKYNKLLNRLYKTKIINFSYFTDEYYFERRMKKYGNDFQDLISFLLTK